MPSTRRAARGFSLSDLAVILALLGVLTALLLPVLHRKLIESQTVVALSQGKKLHMRISFSGGSEWRQGLTMPADWPRSGHVTVVADAQFRSSTEFFVHLTTSDVSRASFRDFAPPGVTPAPGGLTTFTPTNNGWCLVADVDSAYPTMAPVLFTRNLVNFDRMDTPIAERNGWVSPEMLPVDQHAPFRGRNALVLVALDGSGFGLHGVRRSHLVVNALFSQTNASSVRPTNVVLRP